MSTRKFEDLVSFSPKELKKNITQLCKDNIALSKQGIIGVAVSITGHAGLGKTSIIKQVAKEEKMSFVKLNLSNITDTGDLTGFPEIQYQARKGAGEVGWFNEHQLIDARKDGWMVSGINRTGYALPSWLPQDNKPMVLLLDDYNRAAPHMLQATMDLVNDQEYISWRLPIGSTVVLTNNPSEDSEYQGLTEMGAAQTSRFIEWSISFSKEDWAQWAVGAGIDDRCISFVLKYPELLSENKSVNPRIFEKFFRLIACRKDWSTELSKSYISTIGMGSIGKEALMNFRKFIDGDLAKLPSPEDIMKTANYNMKDFIKGFVVDKAGKIREDIGYITLTRLTNYLLTEYANKSFPAEDAKLLYEIGLAEHNNLKVIGEDNWTKALARLTDEGGDRFNSIGIETRLMVDML